MQSSSDKAVANPVLYTSLAEFYPFYLSQHQSRVNRRLHFVGTSLLLLLLLLTALSRSYGLLFGLPVVGYGFAWIGHFAFEKNKPATFKYPFYSLTCDFLMYRDMILGRLSF